MARLIGVASVALISASVACAEELADQKPIDLGVVQVTARPAEKDYAVQNSSIGTKTNTPLMELPMAVEVLPQQVLRDQGITSSGLTDALSYLGVQTLGLKDQGEITIFRGFSSWSTLWNGFRIEEISTSVGPVNGGVWMDNVDRLEVLKGPPSILYGRAEPGGTVNVVTKKPSQDFYAEARAGFGSLADRWIGTDITGALNAAKTLLYRLNVADEESDSQYRFGAEYQSIGFAPALEWRVAANTTLSFEGQYRHLQGLSGQPYIPIDPATGRPISIDPEDTLLPGNDSKFDQYRSYLALNHALNPDWSLSWKYMHNDAENPHSGSNFLLGTAFPIVSGTLPASLMVGFTSSQQRTDATMFDVTGHFDTLGIAHTVLLGGDYYNRRTEQTSGWDFSQTTDYLNPTEPAAVPATDTWNIDSSEWAFYVQDQMELPRRWHLLLGARYQDLDEHSVSEAPSLGLPIQDVTYEKGVFLPRVGLLWNPRPWISAYYSYSENMGANTGLDFSGRPIKPESARQHELGLKGEWMNGRLNALIAVFELTKLNIASADPAHPGFNIGVGEVRSTGYEINVQGAITDKWNVLTNFSFARPFVEEGTEASSIYSGPSIVAGQLLPYVSNKTFSLWTGYRLFGEPNAGLTVGGGVNWSSAANPADGAVVETESHTVASVFSAYETTMASKKVTFQINVNNIFDERYLMFQGDDVVFGGNTLGGNWNAPRQFKFSLIAEF